MLGLASPVSGSVIHVINAVGRLVQSNLVISKSYNPIST